MEKANEAVKDIRNNPPSRIKKDEYQNVAGELAIYFLNLSSLMSVKDCAKNLLTKETAIDILVNNAGVAMIPYEKTEDGNEMTLQTNHLGHFLLTLLLLPKMQSSSPGCRIVNVSSIAHILGDIDFDDINLEKSYPTKSYFQSKLANILFTRELVRRLNKANIHGINVYSLHPGLIPTEITRHWNNTLFPFIGYNFLTWLLFKSVEEGAQTTIYCSVDEKTANETGLYYSDCSIANPQRKATNDQYAKNLWDVSYKLLNLEPEEDFTKFLQTVSRQIL
ncbi:Retinol dehydrogenase 11 [Camponotus japonicus]